VTRYTAVAVDTGDGWVLRVPSLGLEVPVDGPGPAAVDAAARAVAAMVHTPVRDVQVVLAVGRDGLQARGAPSRG
jgi:hypothetical protein